MLRQLVYAARRAATSSVPTNGLIPGTKRICSRAFYTTKNVKGDHGHRIEISPNISLVDEEINITVRGLRPSHHVTLLCRVQESNARFFSYSYYVSDEKGTVDVSTMAAVPGGAYEGIEPMGLIWSQKQEPGQKAGMRIQKSDVTTPILTHVYALDGKVSSDEALDVVTRGQWLCYASCERWYMAEGVERLEIKSGRLKGTLFIPKGSGPFPGVLDLFGGIGHVVEHRSALLASRGIASLAPNYFSGTSSNDSIFGIITDLEYLEEAIDYLLSHPKVSKPYAGTIGVSLGGQMTLMLSCVCSKVAASVVINSGNVLFFDDLWYKGERFPTGDDLWYKGERFPTGDKFVVRNCEFTDAGLVLAPAFKSLGEKAAEENKIPIERGACEYLFILGEDDKSLPASAVAESIVNRLQKHGKTNYRVLMYPGAGHLIEPPHSPHFYATYQPHINRALVYGGRAIEHTRAQEAAWKEVLAFFKDTL